MKVGLGHRVPAFTEPAPSWGAWKGLDEKKRFGEEKGLDVSTFFSRMARKREGWHLIKPSPGRGRGTVEDG